MFKGTTKIDDNSIDSCVTDPPYGWSFMGKKWDYDVPKVDIWREVLRVLKPGGYILCACGTRTQHRMAVNIEDAGFEIRDIVAWVYGSGFPKSLNIGKAVDKIQGNEREKSTYVPNDKNKVYGKGYGGGITDITKGTSKWEGWGTALKPAMELWTLARKPLSEPTVALNVLKWGTGGINIDGSRVESQDDLTKRYNSSFQEGNSQFVSETATGSGKRMEIKAPDGASLGRFPANLIHDGNEEVVEKFPNVKTGNSGNNSNNTGRFYGGGRHRPTDNGGDSGSASRFFYCAKSSKSERNKGLNGTLTVKYNNKVCEENTVAVQLLEKVMSDMALMSFSIGESGVSITAQCHKDSLSTILTTIRKTTALKTLNSLTHLLTNDSTQVANSEMVNGGNLAESAEQLKKWILTTTNGKTELALGANNVALTMLSLISEKENWNVSTNFHSTVKPLSLMRYLCKLITPPKGIVLDPFMGSGTTGIAAKLEEFDFIGIEKDAEYVKIAESRIKAWEWEPEQTNLF